MSYDASDIRKWSRAYAIQAAADWKAYEVLCQAGQDLPKCERLHLLQMACEKLCKAHLMMDGKSGFNPKTHQCIRKVLPAVIRHHLKPKGSIRKQLKNGSGSIVELAGTLAPNIESLAPLSDGHPNSEYPWQDGDSKIWIPAEHDFQALEDLRKPNGIELVKALKSATHGIIRLHAS